ncbi:hypothetical protein FJT64_010266 [Amphibalanus amphitrite]|uniref:Chitin-binding type-2 domain-containing protein n=1 Tax=Amphibalanus amphitrite TaxID=1232801 RepID=A0A6A4VR47_AMPAM|nr:hypothetical protein FJT64_010266 [Amphibalanus amphitrite]
MARWCLLLAAGLLASFGPVESQFPQDQGFQCPAKDGYFADPDNCRKFYQCVDEYPYDQLCPSGLHWDDRRKQCDFKDVAECGPITTTPGPPTTEDPYKATSCDTANCPLPNCFCSKDGTLIPGGLDPSETPQMIILALDGAVNGQNYEHYVRLFNDTEHKNPNECPMRGTFFISHEYTDYQMVQQLYSKSHEIALYSVTRTRSGFKEMVGMRTMLNLWANVSEFEVLGMRSPRLKPGGNEQFNMMLDYGFVWDSSVSVPPVRVPVWPYTLDYKIPHDCRSGGCPTSQYPGKGHSNHSTREDFNRHYENNRAPYVMSFHTNWFNEANLIEGLNKFLKDDTWFVTMTQALLWMSDPVPVNQISQFDDWDCRKRKEVPPPACNLPNSCKVPFKPPPDVDKRWIPGTRYMGTCFSCPKQYPWLYDVDGDGGQADFFEPPEV